MKLPIDALLPQIVAALHREKYLVIEAPPGAGKTTRIPPARLGAARGEIIVRMDAHAEYAQDYIPRCVRLLRQSGARPDFAPSVARQ